MPRPRPGGHRVPTTTPPLQAPPPPAQAPPRSARCPSARKLSKASEEQCSALWKAAGTREGAGAAGSGGAQRGAHWALTARLEPLRARLSTLTFCRATSEPGLGSRRSARSSGARGAQRGARRSLAGEQAPGTHRAPSARRPSVQCGCRCPHGGHGLARPGAGEDGEEAAAAAETAAARLGPGREPRGRGSRARPREHVGPERSAGSAAAGAAALLGPETEPCR